VRQDLVLAQAEHDEASGLLLTRSHMVWAFPRVVEPCMRTSRLAGARATDVLCRGTLAAGITNSARIVHIHQRPAQAFLDDRATQMVRCSSNPHYVPR